MKVARLSKKKPPRIVLHCRSWGRLGLRGGVLTWRLKLAIGLCLFVKLFRKDKIHLKELRLQPEKERAEALHSTLPGDTQTQL